MRWMMKTLPEARTRAISQEVSVSASETDGLSSVTALAGSSTALFFIPTDTETDTDTSLNPPYFDISKMGCSLLALR
jgi:hypothetical protein